MVVFQANEASESRIVNLKLRVSHVTARILFASTRRACLSRHLGFDLFLRLVGNLRMAAFLQASMPVVYDET